MTFPDASGQPDHSHNAGSGPYLPPTGTDPGIPPKWQRPSVRERGLIIAILVVGILGLIGPRFTFTYSGGVEQAVSSALYNYENSREGSNEPGMFPNQYTYRTEVMSVPVDQGTLLYSVVTNEGQYVVPIIGLEVDDVPGGGQATFISGAQSINPGDALVVAVLLEGVETVTPEQLDKVSFSSYVASGASYVVFDGVSSPEDSEHLQTIRSAYDPIAKSQLKKYLDAQ